MKRHRSVLWAAQKAGFTAVCAAVCLLAGCEEEPDPNAQGGGPGSSAPLDPSNVQASDGGFCAPVGGAGALGQAAYSASSTAKIDTDGDPAAQGQDATWSPNTTGKVNGQNVNSARYAYVVMSEGQMAANGVGIGDWALVTNNQTGQQTWARVEDVGPEGGTGEISEATASSVGIGYTTVQYKTGTDTVTIGSPSVTVQAYANTAYIQGDCSG